MEDIILQAVRRTVTGKQVNVLRRAGKLPAVIYGRHTSPIAITLDARDTGRALAGVGETRLVTIDLEGVKHPVLIRERQRDVMRGHLIHVDFLAVSMTEKLRAEVRIELVGNAPIVKDGAILVNGVDTLEIECFPQDLPNTLVLDITGLVRFGQSLLVKDVPIPDKVTLLSDLDDMVVQVTAPAVEAEEDGGTTFAAEPEVIEKGKKDEDED